MTGANVVALIPAYKPGFGFPHFISELIGKGFSRIIVVDDGSGDAFTELFRAIEVHPEVVLCRHAVNLGKGAALKTGINAALCGNPRATVVTADADGQHHPDDVLAVAEFAEGHTGQLILGVRAFSNEVPLRSRLGNKVTRMVLHLVAGQRLSDTQTGLRAIPPALSPALLKLAPRGYEFELDMLLLCRSKGVSIGEVPIRTIYFDGNASSHFNPLFDSMRIYFVLLRFGLISLCTAILDNLVFSGLFLRTGNILTSQLAGRTVAMLFNFFCVKRMVFHSRGRLRREFLGYATLVAVSGACSYGLIALFTRQLGWGVLRAKLLAEGLLFLVNFLVQRDLVFTGGPQENTSGKPAPETGI